MSVGDLAPFMNDWFATRPLVFGDGLRIVLIGAGVMLARIRRSRAASASSTTL